MCKGGTSEEEKLHPVMRRSEDVFPPGVLRYSPHLVYAKDVVITDDGAAHKEYEHYVQAAVCYQGDGLMQKQCTAAAHAKRTQGVLKVASVLVISQMMGEHSLLLIVPLSIVSISNSSYR
jgi:hypothetical protein